MVHRRSHFKRPLVLALVAALRLPVAAFFLFFRFWPERWAFVFARPLGRLIRIGKKREIFERIRIVLGEEALADGRAKKFWRAHVAHLGCTAIEPIYFYHMSDDDLRARVAIEGEEHLRAALATGRGAVLFLNHLGNPGAIVAGFGLRGYDLTIAGNRIVASLAGEEVALDHVEEIVQRMFNRGHVQRALLGDRLPQRAAATLQRNGLFAMFIDFPVAQKHNHWTALGDARMKVNLGPAILALRNAAVVLCVCCRRVGANQHRLTIHPPLHCSMDQPHPEAAAGLIQQAIDLLRADLQTHPEQWWPWDWARIAAAERRAVS